MYKNNIRNGILNFDMENFFAPRANNDSNGAILMITSNQIVLALNSDKGAGSHAKAFAEAISEIYGIPIENGTTQEIIGISSIADHKISARLVNEGEAGTYLAFLLGDLKSITENEYKSFERFYFKYNDTIKKISRQYGFPIVNCIVPNHDERIKNKFGMIAKTINIESEDLTPVLESLKKIIDINKHDEEEKKIIELSKEEKSDIYKNTIMEYFGNLLKIFEKYKQLYNADTLDYEKQIKEIENKILEKSHDGFTLIEARELMQIIIELNKHIESNLEVNKNTR